MSDFRTELYERYVSTFKGSEATGPSTSANVSEGRGAFLDWCRYKYLPLFAGLPKDARIVELGCGPGDMLELLRQDGFTQVEGIDISPEQVQIASGRGLDARVEDVFACLDRASGRYRVIMAVDFIEHFSKDELMRLIPAIAAALEPGGHLILQTPNGEGLFPRQIIYGDLTHLTIFTPGSMKQLLRLWGFDDFRFVATGPVPSDWRGMMRALIWKLVTIGANIVRRIETGKSQAIWTENLICRCSKTRTQLTPTSHEE